MHNLSLRRIGAMLRRLSKDATTAFVLAIAVHGAAYAGALPQAPQVVTGSVQIQTAPNQLIINQSTDRAAINWQSFSVGSGNTVQINQPNSQSIQLDQVIGNSISKIFGALDSNGRVILANPNGVWFGPHSQVDVAGIVATTSTASAADMAAFGAGGALNMSQAGKANAAILNQGSITVSQAGLAAFVAPTVANDGLITARLGTVQLSSGTTPTLDFYGDGLISLAIMGQTTGHSDTAFGQAPTTAAVQNTGTISAPGGTVLLSANVAAGVVNQVINSSGVIEAKSVGEHNGQIVLNGGSTGTVTVAGTLDASGLASGQTGGTVKVLGNTIALTGTAKINASGDAGGGNVMIGGDFHGAGPDPDATATTVAMGATIAADAVTSGNGGNVAVWSNQSTSFDGNISAMGGLRGKGGFVETSGANLNVGNDATVNTLAAQGAAGTWLLDPNNYTIAPTGGNITGSTLSANLNAGNVAINTATQGTTGGNGDIFVNDSLTWSTHTLTLEAGRNITISDPITATSGGLTLDAATVTSTGTITNSATAAGINVGTFLLQGGAWSQVQPTLPSFAATNFEITGGSFLRATSGTGTGPYVITDIYGLQGAATLPGDSFTLGGNIDATGTPSWNGNKGFTPIGSSTKPYTGTFNGANFTISGLTINLPTLSNIGLFGDVGSAGIVENVALSGGSITGRGNVGAIAGTNAGTISNSNATYTAAGTNVSGQSGGTNVGGLVGVNTGSISNSYTDANVSGVTQELGGLVGASSGPISGSYATGTVADGTTTGTSNIGGLVGQVTGGSITNSYATGNVTGGQQVGGLIGFDNAATISQSYATGNVTGNGSGPNQIGGLVGTKTGGSISQSYATGNVSGATDIGGLVGLNEAPITDAYAQGTVTGSATGNSVGGLIGENSNATVKFVYATGAVTGDTGGSGALGALIGSNSGTVSYGYWDTTVTGSLPGLGTGNPTLTNSAGETTATLQSGTLPTGFNNAGDGDGAAVWTASSGKFPTFGWQVPPVIVSGVLYSDLGITPLGSGITVDIVSGGVLLEAVTSTTGGDYTASVSSNGIKNSSVLAYIASGSTKGSTFTDTGVYTGLDIWGSTTRLVTNDSKLSTVLGNLNTTLTGYSDASGYLGMVTTATGLTATANANNSVILNAPGSFTVDGTISASGQILVTTPDNLTLGVGASLTSTATGDAIVLAATGNFTNSTTLAPLSASNGSWLVYSSTSSGDTFGSDLNSGNTAVWDTSYPSTVSATGNRYVFAFQPTLTVTTTNDTKTYGQDWTSNVAADYTISGLQSAVTGAYLADTTSGAPTVTSTGSAPTANVSSGPYAIIATQTGLTVPSGYQVSFVNTGLLAVDPAALTVTPNAVSTTYSASALNNATYSDNTGNYSITGFANSQSVGTAGVTLSGSMAFNGSTGTNVLNAGTYTQGAGSLVLSSNFGNYSLSFSNPTPNNYVINPAALIVTPNAVSTTYNALALNNTSYSDNAANYTFGPLKGSDTLSSQGITLSGSMAFNGSTGTAVLNAGTYTQGAGSLAVNSTFGNYALSFSNPVPNNYVINPAALVVTPNAVSTTYNGVALTNATYSDNTGNYTFGPLQGSDTLSSQGITLSGSMAFNGSTGTSVLNQGTYTQGAGSLALNSNFGNYTLSFSNPVPHNYVINPATLTVTPDAVSTTYSGVALNNATYSDNTGNYSFGPLQGSDTLSSQGITLSGSMAFNGSTTTSVLNQGTYTQGIGSLALNSTFGNYTLSFSNPVPHNYVINPAALTVTPDAVSVTFSDIALNNTSYSDNTGNYHISGLVNGQSLSQAGITLSGSMAFNGSTSTVVENAGTYTQAVGSLSLSSSHGNYVMSFSNPTPNNYVINPAALTVTPDAVSTTYSGVALNNTTYSDDTGNYSISGFVNGQHINSAGISLTGSMAFNGSTSTTVENAGTYTQAVGTLALVSNNNNYSLNFVNSPPHNYVINPKLLTVTGEKFYDDSTLFNTAELTVSGAVHGEIVSLTAGTGTATSINANTYFTNNNLSGLAITVGGSNNVAANYTLPTRGLLTIDPAALTITAATASKTYDGTTSSSGAPTYQVTSVNPGATELNPNTLYAPDSLTNLSQSFQSVNVLGTNGSTLAVNNNYHLFNSNNYNVTLATNTGTISPKALTVSGERSYDGTTLFQTGDLSVSGAVSGEHISLTNGTGTTTSPNANTYADSSLSGLQIHVSGTNNRAGNYSLPSSGTLIIDPAALTVTANDDEFTYDGLSFTGGNGVSYNGFVNHENSSVLSGTVTYSGSSQGAVNAGFYTITPSGLTANNGNYAITYRNGTLTIDPVQLTVTGTKTYDGTVFFTTSNLSASGAVDGENVTLTGGSSFTLNPNVGGYTGLLLFPSISVAAGTNSANKNPVPGDYSFPLFIPLNIDPAQLTVSIVNDPTKFYDSTDAAALTASNYSLVGFVTGQGATVTQTSGTYASANASNPDVVTASLSSGNFKANGGTSLSNYILPTTASGNGTINAATVTVAAQSDTKFYDGNTNSSLTPTFQVTSFNSNLAETELAANTLYSSDKFTTLTQTFNSPNVLTATTLTATAVIGSNYTIVGTPATALGTINPATVTVAATADTKFYDGNTNSAQTPTFQVTSSNKGLNDGLGGNTLYTNAGTGADSFTTLTQTFNSPNVLTATTLTATAVIGSNYTIVGTPATAVGVINPAALTISATTDTKVYDSTPDSSAMPTYQVTTSNKGLNDGLGANALYGSDSFTTAPTQSFDSPNVGPRTLSINAGYALSDPSNYSVTLATASGGITAAGLTVTADNQGKVYGQTFTFAGTEFTTKGLQGNDSVTSATLISGGAAPTATYVSPGPTYAIDISGASGTGLSNYTITYVPGTMTLSPAALTVTASDQGKVYGQTFTFAGTEFTTKGLVNSDSVTSATLTSGGAAPTATVVAPGPTYAININGALGSGLGNYTITYVPGTMTLSPAALTVTASDQSKVYGDTFTFAGTEFTTAGLVNGDAVTSASLSSNGAAATATVVAPGPTYAINIAGASGSGLGNYTIAYVPGTLTVTPASLIVGADDVIKQFGTTFTFAGTEFTTAGLVNGDTVTLADISSAGSAANAIEAFFPIAISNASGSGLGNYAITYLPGVMDVTASPSLACEPNCTVPHSPTGLTTLADPNFSFLPNGVNPASGNPSDINPAAGSQFCQNPQSQQCVAWLAEVQAYLEGNRFLGGQFGPN